MGFFDKKTTDKIIESTTHIYFNNHRISDIKLDLLTMIKFRDKIKKFQTDDDNVRTKATKKKRCNVLMLMVG